MNLFWEVNGGLIIGVVAGMIGCVCIVGAIIYFKCENHEEEPKEQIEFSNI